MKLTERELYLELKRLVGIYFNYTGDSKDKLMLSNSIIFQLQAIAKYEKDQVDRKEIRQKQREAEKLGIKEKRNDNI